MLSFMVSSYYDSKTIFVTFVFHIVQLPNESSFGVSNQYCQSEVENWKFDLFLGIFNKGERLYGRVFWDPKQDLDSAFRIQLDKVFICAGRNGYTPAYDPTGKIYNEGPQYGCLEPSGKLKHRFLILVRYITTWCHSR